ncbi:MAG: PocR ligand-binding domain-containing protein [Deltaproteobacteria bacterium]|uniref:PocR ligand-binding domain-containing protein n=1 Tax=Desulfobacula sp. TaxID=2593537 RepID=UPI0019B5232A|nr:PocR ligand-binding domain-containing protein [Candidatus Desulfobacula maris]MBL6993679.1 PocR ligand-binding domain-containing protein [Desulfobacula sp.]
MELTDLAPLEAWAQIEKESFKKFNLQSSVFNTDGIRITDTKNWANKICPEIKSTDKGQSFICATAHMNLANQARQTKKPVIEECDAGLVKIVIPIFIDDEFLGAAGGCGLLLEGGEVDLFSINKITDIDETIIEKLSEEIPVIPTQTAETIRDFFMKKVNTLVSKYQETINSPVLF